MRSFKAKGEGGGKEGRTGCFGWRRDTFALFPSFQGAREEGDSVGLRRGTAPKQKVSSSPIFDAISPIFVPP